MEVKSTTKYVRLSPQKARDVAREIQGRPVSEALDILNYTPKKAAMLIGKTLKTAIADAENNFSLDSASLVVKEAVIGAGPTLSRFMPRAKGSASPIIRRTSNIYITLSGEEGGAKKRREVSKVVRKAAPITAKAATGEAAPDEPATEATVTEITAEAPLTETVSSASVEPETEAAPATDGETSANKD
jgi:large subunit ribosomal protein L22